MRFVGAGCGFGEGMRREEERRGKRDKK